MTDTLPNIDFYRDRQVPNIRYALTRSAELNNKLDYFPFTHAREWKRPTKHTTVSSIATIGAIAILDHTIDNCYVSIYGALAIVETIEDGIITLSMFSDSTDCVFYTTIKQTDAVYLTNKLPLDD